MGKKKFIDKKKSATFQLIARDTSDPSYDIGPSGDRVFVRVDSSPYSIDGFFDDQKDAVPSDSDSIFADAPGDVDGVTLGGQFGPPPPLPDRVRREILELGFPDDGYNYLAHLREIKNTGGGSAFYENPKARLYQIPRDVKAYDASRIEIFDVNDESYEKSIYNVASKTVGVRIKKAIDPEVNALLDDSDLSRYGSDVEDLEEDFVVKANLPQEPAYLELDKLSLVEGSELNGKKNNGYDSSCSHKKVVDILDMPEVKNHMLDAGECVDEKPRVRRLLDEQFDTLELQEYADSEDGYDASTGEENECYESLAEKLTHALKDHVRDDLELSSKYKVPSDLVQDSKRVNDLESLDAAADVICRCIEYAEKYENDDQGEDVVVLKESSDESEVWDCETVMSTYSNLDNRPGKIGAPVNRRKKKLVETVSGPLSAPVHVISLKGKEKLPVDFLPGSRKSTEKVKDGGRLLPELQNRKHHGQETKEEKKERKVAVKEERRQARRVKKELKGIYKCEAQHAQKVAAFTGPSSIHL
ncbi:hypothetical protein RJ639_013790, partial [Escallonia herrerae]